MRRGGRTQPIKRNTSPRVVENDGYSDSDKSDIGDEPLRRHEAKLPYDDVIKYYLSTWKTL